MAGRMMTAYKSLGCEPTWTCAPYQAGHRPRLGSQVAWGESNAVAFCNSVLGARTNRYGDFLDIACAISGRAPDYGLHRTENRRATVVFDVSQHRSGVPVFGRRVAGARQSVRPGDRRAIGVISGLSFRPWEDILKAFGATAASAGSVGLFHVAGATPEAPDEATALHHVPPAERIVVTTEMVRDAQRRLSTAERADRIDAVAIGSPHLSLEEFDTLRRLLKGRKVAVPIYACTGRHVLRILERDGHRQELEAERHHHRRRHLRGRDADPAGEAGRDPDDELRQVLALRAGEHRLFGAVWIDGRLRRERGHGRSGVRSARRDAIQRRSAAVRARRRRATALALTAPISFWGGVDPKTGVIADARHPEFGQSIAGRVLLVPATVGSSSAAAILLELVHARPRARGDRAARTGRDPAAGTDRGEGDGVEDAHRLAPRSRSVRCAPRQRDSRSLQGRRSFPADLKRHRAADAVQLIAEQRRIADRAIAEAEHQPLACRQVPHHIDLRLGDEEVVVDRDRGRRDRSSEGSLA